MKRRKMLHSSALAIGGLCSCAYLFGKDNLKSNCCFTPEIEAESLSIEANIIQIDLKKAASINEPGYASFIIDQERNIDLILVHDDSGKFHALQRLCTHGGRSLSYINQRGLLQCNNYNHSTFKLNGEVYNGPAPTALKSYPIMLKNNFLEISLLQGHEI